MGTGVLPYATGLSRVQDALVSTIELAFSQRQTVADLVALAATPSRSGTSVAVLDRSLAYVTSAVAVYKFSQYSTLSASATVVVPDDAGSLPGRWLLTSSPILAVDGTAISSVATGYLRRVMLWAGERGEKAWKVRVLGQRPAVVVQFLGETKTIRSNPRGALAEKEYHFSLWAVSQNLRPDLEGEKGSPVSAEAVADPGVARIMGDLEDILDGLNGDYLGVDGVDYLKFGAQEPGVEDYDGREFVWTVPLDVRVTIGKEDRPTRYSFTTLFAQSEDVQLHGQPAVDSLNYLISGLTVPLGGFTQTPAPGSAYVAGALVNSTPPAHTFTASRATYRDLRPDSSLVYVETWSDDTPPLVTDGALRIGVTFTSFSGVIEDRLLVASVSPVGPNNEIYPVADGVSDNRVYYGVSTDPGVYDQSFVEFSFSSGVSDTRQRAIQYNAGAGQFLWYWIPVSYGGSPANFIDADTQSVAGFSVAGTATRTEPGGAIVVYNGWRSDSTGLGPITVNVT
jgi:hypothetical protein